MKVSSTALVALGILGLVLLSFTGQCYGELKVGFYKETSKCLTAEETVARITKEMFNKDPTIAPALIRMQFHDCFVNGCDASILLDGRSSEKTAPPNLSVRGYEVIDAAKSALENECQGVVSCSDIIALATRDAVVQSGGGRYDVETGRLDGLVSLATNVRLPAPSSSVNESLKAFAAKRLNADDMVYLLGGHTIGVAHCNFFQDRLYNFQNTGKPDPNMESSLLEKLKGICPRSSSGTSSTANLDQGQLNAASVDNSFYNQILTKRGVLQIDQDIAFHTLTKDAVKEMANSNFVFSTKFGQAMVKLGAVEVITDKSKGEIRKSCRSVNSRWSSFFGF